VLKDPTESHRILKLKRIELQKLVHSSLERRTTLARDLATSLLSDNRRRDRMPPIRKKRMRLYESVGKRGALAILKEGELPEKYTVHCRKPMT
jgi:hypothetical protein